MIILHSYRRCPFAIRVRMTLHEKQIPHQIIEEDLSELSPTLLALHPEGRVPLLIDGDHVIYESSVITEYLDEKFPTPRLMPKSPELRARVRLLTHGCNQIFKPDLDRFKYDWRHSNPEEQSQIVRAIHAHLDTLEKTLGDQDFLLGQKISLADIHFFPFFRQLTRCTSPAFPELEKRVRLQAWLTRLTSRPSFERAMTLHSPSD